MFTDEFRRQLEIGKYTRWASQLTPEQMQGLLWALGEFGSRRIGHSNVLDRLQDCAEWAGLHPRAQAGLRMALQFMSGHRRTVDEVTAVIRNVAKDGGAINESM